MVIEEEEVAVLAIVVVAEVEQLETKVLEVQDLPVRSMAEPIIMLSIASTDLMSLTPHKLNILPTMAEDSPFNSLHSTLSHNSLLLPLSYSITLLCSMPHHRPPQLPWQSSSHPSNGQFSGTHQNSGPMAMVASNVNHESNVWYPNRRKSWLSMYKPPAMTIPSNTTHHVTSDANNLLQQTDSCGTNNIFMGNGLGIYLY